MAAGQSPKYVSIAAKLTSAIEAGRYNAGEQLPPETRLAEEYRVTVPTIRRAMALLRSQNLVEPRQGVGTFVRSLSSSQFPEHSEDSASDFQVERTTDMRPWPRHVRSLVEMTDSQIPCVAKFEVTSTSDSRRMLRVLYLSPTDPALLETEDAFEAILNEERAGARVFRIARPTDGLEAELLGLLPGDPVLSTVKPLGDARVLDTVFPGDTLVPGVD